MDQKQLRTIKRFVSTETSREVLTKVLVKDNVAVATDSYSLLILPVEGDEKMLIDPKTGEPTELKADSFPNYKSIVPIKEPQNSIEVNIDFLFKTIQALKEHGVGNEKCLKESLDQEGNKGMTIEFYGANNAVVFKTLNKDGKTIKALIMPIKR